MSTVPPAGTHAGEGAPAYARHRPEQTLLYRLVEEHYPAFVTRLAAEGRTLPRHVAREFEDFLACGRLENGFLRGGCRAERLVAFSCKRRGFCPSCGARRMAESAALLVDDVFPARPVRQWVLSVPWQLRFLFAHDPAIMGAALGVVHRCITSYLIAKARSTRDGACTGAVTLIQRFGGALNLNVHFHMLFLDGVYVERPDGTLRFRRIGAPTSTELDELTRTIAHRAGRLLERRGLLERDAEGAWLVGDDGAEPTPIDELRAASVTYRVAIGPRRGSKAFTLRTLPPAPDEPLDDRPGGAGGFSLHAGVATGANERAKLERLCRYISRPALSEKRLSLTAVPTELVTGLYLIEFVPVLFLRPSATRPFSGPLVRDQQSACSVLRVGRADAFGSVSIPQQRDSHKGSGSLVSIRVGVCSMLRNCAHVPTSTRLKIACIVSTR